MRTALSETRGRRRLFLPLHRVEKKETICSEPILQDQHAARRQLRLDPPGGSSFFVFATQCHSKAHFQETPEQNFHSSSFSSWQRSFLFFLSLSFARYNSSAICETKRAVVSSSLLSPFRLVRSGVTDGHTACLTPSRMGLCLKYAPLFGL